MTTFPENLFQINMLTLGELNILEKSRSVHSLHVCVIMVALKIYHIGSKTRGYTLLNLHKQTDRLDQILADD